MKAKVVTLSQVGEHPFHSLLPQDYIGGADYVKSLIQRNNHNDQIRIRWMLEKGVITEAQLRQYAEEMKHKPAETMKEIDDKVQSILEGE
jgi:hypothetical protein